MSSSESTKWAYELVAVTPGAWYQFDGSVFSYHPGVESAWLRISWYASADGSGSALASVDSLKQLDSAQAGYRGLGTGPVQAPPSANSARARIMLRPFSALSALIYIDDVSFLAVEPPELQIAVNTEAGAEAGSDEAYSAPPRSSGVGSQVLGRRLVAQSGPQSTPVIQRSSVELPDAGATNDDGGSNRSWLLVLAASITAAGLALPVAYRWRREGDSV